MSFVTKCLAVKNDKQPLRSRCQNIPVDGNILCCDHIKEAKKKPISILMHKEVTKNFGIAFKNQVTVKVCFKNEPDKPQSQFQDDEKKRLMKTKLFDDLREQPIEKIKEYWEKLRMGKWNREGYEGYKLSYFMTKEVIDKLISLSY